LYKDYEHGKLKEIDGAEIDKLLKASKEYDGHLKVLRKKLEGRLVEQTVKQVHESTFGLLKNIFGNHSEDKLISMFQKEIIKQGKLPERYGPVLKEISTVRERSKKMSQGEIDNVRREAEDFMGKLVEYMQRKDLIKSEKGVLKINYKDKKAELVLTHEASFLVMEGKIKKVSTHSLTESNANELEKAMHATHDGKDTHLPSHVLSVLKKELGDFTIVL
jgi:hypothetical protein